MPPRSESVHYPPEAGADADHLIVGVESPPAWSKTLQWVPLLGTYLNIMAQAQAYVTPLEDCVDFIARDLSAGSDSQFIGHRVGVKVRSRQS
ncbi:hypothetical protein LTR08_003470 [Meristemomyces frigidus]|nr:hypothetical protein LTR08_003470 [Meristemomyces frigidus]